MNKFLMAFFMLILSLYISTSYSEQGHQRKTNLYTGTVQKVDLKTKNIIVGKPGSEIAMSFSISETELEGYKSLKNIKRGDYVRIEYDARLGKMIAVKISKVK